MRFACESCQTRYVVSDDRIRGRTLKVRCKKCGNLILLKAAPELRSETIEPAAAARVDAARVSRDEADEATLMVDAVRLGAISARGSGGPGNGTPEAAAAQNESAEWHVILPAGQQGPLPLSALIQKMLGGDMSPRTFVWRDGMPDWKRTHEVPEVARWLPAARPNSAASVTSQGAGGVDARRTPLSTEAGVSEGHEEAVQEFFEDGEKGADSAQMRTPTPDPLARVRSSPEFSSANPGELTKFFITQAHVSKGRSPWAVIAFGLGAAVLLVGGLIGLAELGVPVPLVAENPKNQPKIFTGAQGDSRMRDMLYGRPKAPGGGQAGASRRAATPGPSEPGTAQGPLATRAEQHVDQLGKSDKDQLSRLYATQDLSNLKLKPSGAALPVLDRADAPLTPEQVSRTIAKFQTGYTRCIDGELKRNPNFQGGKIRIVTTIMSSGLVRQAQIVSDDQRLQRSVAGGPLGSCLSEQTRRMVFPSFQGEPFDAEIPLVLSSAL